MSGRVREMCCVCQLRPAAGSLMCKPCGASYDRDLSRGDGTVAGAIVWAANRARRFATKRPVGTVFGADELAALHDRVLSAWQVQHEGEDAEVFWRHLLEKLRPLDRGRR